MDFQHKGGNILGWQHLKRQHSPVRDGRPLKKCYGTENVSPERRTSREILPNTVQIDSHNTKRHSSHKSIPNSNTKGITSVYRWEKETPNLEKERDVNVAPENNLDMDDVIMLDLNLSKTPIKYCDDRLYVDLVKSDDSPKAERLSRDYSRQANENFREKVRKPLNELLDLFDIRTDEEPIQYILVGLKLQLLGRRMATLDDK